MHILMTGGTGHLGRFITQSLVAAGHRVTHLGRLESTIENVGFVSWHLSSERGDLPAADALVHCALDHVPGKFDEGEGDDPEGFWDRNANGTRRLFEAARNSGIRHCVFLSSQAVYANNNRWEVLTESATVNPDTLYGKVKLEGEEALKGLCSETFAGTVLRSTGVYGVPPGLSTHKWGDLFQAFEAGVTVHPQLGTEVHGDDLATAVLLVLERLSETPIVFETYNVSDVLLDRQDLLTLYAEALGKAGAIPGRAEGPLGILEPGKLKVLGWNPGGQARLEEFVRSLVVKPS